ncbi:hypothetical protein ACLOJK_004431 [Asimina triloba]
MTRSGVACRWKVRLLLRTARGREVDLLQLDVTALLMGGGLAGVVEEGGGAARLWI